MLGYDSVMTMRTVQQVEEKGIQACKIDKPEEVINRLRQGLYKW